MRRPSLQSMDKLSIMMVYIESCRHPPSSVRCSLPTARHPSTFSFRTQFDFQLSLSLSLPSFFNGTARAAGGGGMEGRERDRERERVPSFFASSPGLRNGG